VKQFIHSLAVVQVILLNKEHPLKIIGTMFVPKAPHSNTGSKGGFQVKFGPGFLIEVIEVYKTVFVLTRYY